LTDGSVLVHEVLILCLPFIISSQRKGKRRKGGKGRKERGGRKRGGEGKTGGTRPVGQTIFAQGYYLSSSFLLSFPAKKGKKEKEKRKEGRTKRAKNKDR